MANVEQHAPVVLGGSLTRSPTGRLQTLQTHGLYPTPVGVQQVWSHVRRRRYPAAWEGQPLASAGYVIEWSEPRKLTCGGPRCRRSLGEYVAYHARDEYGIVENTARTYEMVAGLGEAPGARQARTRPRLSLEGEAHGHAARTRALFWCGNCKRYRRRNLAALGKALFADDGPNAFIV